jgi:hypothetical protein
MQNVRVMNDPGLPSPYSESLPVAAGSPVLSAQQQAFFDVLNRRDRRLADMYLGALWVLNQGSNPDRVPQAAHSMRELMEKLPRYLELPVPKNPTSLSYQVDSLQAKWKRVQQHPEGVTPTNDRLWNFLKELQLFFDAVEQNGVYWKDIGRLIQDELDPAGLPLPKVLRDQRAADWVTLRNYFVKVCHHGSPTDAVDLADKIDALETFLLDYLRPRTLDNQAEILALIREGEAHGHT